MNTKPPKGTTTVIMKSVRQIVDTITLQARFLDITTDTTASVYIDVDVIDIHLEPVGQTMRAIRHTIHALTHSVTVVDFHSQLFENEELFNLPPPTHNANMFLSKASLCAIGVPDAFYFG